MSAHPQHLVQHLVQHLGQHLVQHLGQHLGQLLPPSLVVLAAHLHLVIKERVLGQLVPAPSPNSITVTSSPRQLSRWCLADTVRLVLCLCLCLYTRKFKEIIHNNKDYLKIKATANSCQSDEASCNCSLQQRCDWSELATAAL